jgi:hypothetical protein
VQGAVLLMCGVDGTAAQNETPAIVFKERPLAIIYNPQNLFMNLNYQKFVKRTGYVCASLNCYDDDATHARE